jgi:transposase InsO family protein
VSYIVEVYYTDNGWKYTDSPDAHTFITQRREAEIEQSFARLETPRTNEKAERVVRTIRGSCLRRQSFSRVFIVRMS